MQGAVNACITRSEGKYNTIAIFEKSAKTQ